jgi:hypothetical protein
MLDETKRDEIILALADALVEIAECLGPRSNSLYGESPADGRMQVARVLGDHTEPIAQIRLVAYARSDAARWGDPAALWNDPAA